MINIAVCDDEKHFTELLSDKIYKFFSAAKIETTVKKFLCAEALLNDDTVFDAVFLDIKMEPLGGYDAARAMRGRGFTGVMIFVTAFREEVFGAFEFNAFDYLVKPLDDAGFGKAMNRLCGSLQNGKRQLLIRRKNDLSVVRFSDILYCEVIDRKVYIHTASGSTVDFYGRIGELSESLDGTFFKCHRSYIVNLAHCGSFDSRMLTLSNGERIPVSRLRTEAFLCALADHIEGSKLH